MYSAIATTRFILGINPKQNYKGKTQLEDHGLWSTYGFHTKDEWL